MENWRLLITASNTVYATTKSKHQEILFEFIILSSSLPWNTLSQVDKLDEHNNLTLFCICNDGYVVISQHALQETIHHWWEFVMSLDICVGKFVMSFDTKPLKMVIKQLLVMNKTQWDCNPQQTQWRCELTPYSQRAHLNISLWGITARSQWVNTVGSQETD